jgi:hypothetical protein
MQVLVQVATTKHRHICWEARAFDCAANLTTCIERHPVSESLYLDKGWVAAKKSSHATGMKNVD